MGLLWGHFWCQDTCDKGYPFPSLVLESETVDSLALTGALVGGWTAAVGHQQSSSWCSLLMGRGAQSLSLC